MVLKTVQEGPGKLWKLQIILYPVLVSNHIVPQGLGLSLLSYNEVSGLDALFTNNSIVWEFCLKLELSFSVY